MSRILIALVALVGFGLGGAKLYLWYHTKQFADQLIQKTAPFAVVSYGGISSSLDGRVGLEDIVISPRGVRDEIHIAAAELQASDLMTLLAARRELAAQQLPSAMGLRLRGLTLASDGPLVAALARPESGGLAPHPFAALGCADLSAVGPAELKALGYSHLISDVALDYEILNGSNALRVHVRSAAREMATLTAVVEMELPDVAGGLRKTSPAEIRFTRADVRYVDEGFNRRLARFCSALLGSDDSEAFLTRHVAEIEQRLPLIGLVADAPLIAAYHRFLKEPGEMRLRLEPNIPVRPAELGLYQPSDLLRVLSPRLSINGQDVALNAAPTPYRQPLRSILSETTRAASPDPADAAIAAAKYHRVETAELPLYVGRPIKLSLLSGKRYQGVLEGLRTDSVLVKRQLLGGSMTMPIATSDIREIEVLY